MKAVPDLSPESFVAEWRGRNLSERQAAHAHFIQLCRLIGVDAPLDRRGQDAEYLFDAVTESAGSKAYAPLGRRAKRAQPAVPGLFGDTQSVDETQGSGSEGATANPAFEAAIRVVSSKNSYGFADVWKHGCFCWEYKRQDKHADLTAALAQLRLYAPSLGNPPLLIVCDIDAFEIHTNFTNYPTTTHRFTLEDLASPPEEWITKHGISPLNLLRAAFDPDEVDRVFKPKKTLNAITEDYAAKIADLADTLDPAVTEDGKPVTRQETAHFLMQVVFCMFAEDVGLLPKDKMTRLLQQGNTDPKGFTRKVRALFAAMEAGGDFGEDTIAWFNGGLFKNVAQQRIPKLTAGQLGVFVTVGGDDWSAIEPSILGTLFERALNTDKRSQRGAHYTSRDDIMLIVEPVVLAPLRNEWAQTQKTVFELVAKRDRTKGKPAYDAAQKKISESLTAFRDRLAAVTILDPACGSGNFLYVAIQCLLDLEREVIAFAARAEVNVRLTSKVSPRQLRGIEIDEYAAELARVSIWIGFLKWKHVNALVDAKRPILDSLDTIETRDAILDRSKKLPVPAKWPDADCIVGNPPFLGSKLFRAKGLADDYLADLYRAYDLPKTSDLCCYWFERARQIIEKRTRVRAGLLATQGIRGGDNRTVLERIKKTGDIFMAWSDREWVLDGAAVQVSMVGFDDGTQHKRTLDGIAVTEIHAELSDDVNVGEAVQLAENARTAFMGDTKGGPFDIDLAEVIGMLAQPNPNQRPSKDVLRPWANGKDVVQRRRGLWVIDFGVATPKGVAAGYEAPFRYVEQLVKAARKATRQAREASEWWLHVRPRRELRAKVGDLSRYLVTATLTKHRFFDWMESASLPDHQLIVFARSDDYFFGVLHSAVHEVWALRQGTQLEDRPRYTPTSTFETFPLPWPPGREPSDPKGKSVKPAQHALWKSISDAAAELNALREQWLNPPEWIAEVEKKVDIAYREQLAAVPADVRPLVRRSAVMAEAAKDKRLKTRTLTNLYNERPAWLRLAHERLDRAVLAAYAATDPKGKWDPEWAAAYEPYGAGEITIKTKGTRSSAADRPEVVAGKQAAKTRRAEVDGMILAALLRLNTQRAGG